MSAPDDFAAFYFPYHHITEKRAKMMQRVFRELEAHTGKELVDVEADELQDYLATLIASGLVPKTIAGRVYALRPFFHWAWQQKLIDAERFMELKDVELPRGASSDGRPNPYPRKEIKQFWRELDETYPVDERFDHWLARWHRGTSKWARVQRTAKRIQTEAIVALALGGGLRRDEIWNMQLDDLEPDAEYLVVRRTARKNREGIDKPRAVPWTSDWMRDAVRRWIDLRERIDPGHDGPWLSLHQQHFRQPMSYRKFELLLHDIGSGWSYQRMRHTCATELLRTRKWELHEVQKLLGHSRIQQTLAYAELLPDDIVRAARRGAEDYGEAVAPPIAA